MTARALPSARRSRGSFGVKIFLMAFFVAAVLLPLLRMLVKMSETDVGALLTSARFLTGLQHSLTASLVATLISVGLALLLSWCLVRSGIRFKGIWSVLFTLPMLIPSISHGTGLVVLFGRNGVLTNLLGINGNIYGFWGIVIGSVMYSFPVAFLMLSDVLRYENSTPYEAASVMGLSRWRQFRAITLPYLYRPLISAIFAVFTMVITDYGVPLMIGGRYQTLPVMMYQDVIGLLDFGKGSVIGLVLLLPAFVAFIVDLFNQERGGLSFVTKPFETARNRLRDGLSYVICVCVSVAVLLPIGAFAMLTFVKKYPLDMHFTFDNINRAMEMGAGERLGNSLLIALGVSLVGVLVAYTTAYFTARMPSKLSRALHLLSITSLAIPGLVLGISYVLFFKGSFLYGTFAILILVNLMHFFASPYLMMYNTLGKINQNLEAVGATLGISRMRVILHVLVPQSKATIVEMFTYFFVNSMMTISAVSFLATLETQPVSLMINMFEAQMMLECQAFVSLLILFVNLVLKGFFGLYRRKLVKEKMV